MVLEFLVIKYLRVPSSSSLSSSLFLLCAFRGKILWQEEEIRLKSNTRVAFEKVPKKKKKKKHRSTQWTNPSSFPSMVRSLSSSVVVSSSLLVKLVKPHHKSFMVKNLINISWYTTTASHFLRGCLHASLKWERGVGGSVWGGVNVITRMNNKRWAGHNVVGKTQRDALVWQVHTHTRHLKRNENVGLTVGGLQIGSRSMAG